MAGLLLRRFQIFNRVKEKRDKLLKYLKEYRISRFFSGVMLRQERPDSSLVRVAHRAWESEVREIDKTGGYS